VAQTAVLAVTVGLVAVVVTAVLDVQVQVLVRQVKAEMEGITAVSKPLTILLVAAAEKVVEEIMRQTQQRLVQVLTVKRQASQVFQ
jgi:hypothetical protein